MANISTVDAPAFAAWAILSNPNGMSESDVKKALASNGVEIKPYTDASGAPSVQTKRGSLQIGEIVIVDGEKCTNPNNMAHCKALTYKPENPIYFVVKDVICPEDLDSKCSVVISPLNEKGKPTSKTFIFEADLPARISEITKKIQSAQKKGDTQKEEDLKRELREKSLTPHAGLGLYRTGFSSVGSYQRYLKEYESSTLFVVVYERSTQTPTPKVRSEFISDYSSRSIQQTQTFGEFDDVIDEISQYASRFYEAPIKFGALSKEGSLYFGMDTRRTRGSNSIMSPSKGKVYFIAPVSALPSDSTWKQDLRDRLEDLAQES